MNGWLRGEKGRHAGPYQECRRSSMLMGVAMTEKLSLYDFFASIIPGSLVVCLVAFGLPEVAAQARDIKLPDAFAVVALVSLALFFGNVMQAIASLIEPVLYRSWGGRPSDYCFTRGLGDRYLPLDSAQRIRGKLALAVGDGASDRSLFLYAMQHAEAATGQRVTTFNALFAYHRLLLVLMTVGFVTSFVVLCGYGPDTWPMKVRWTLFTGSLGLLVLLWFRAKQRGLYYVREVLFTAERVLDEKSAKNSDAK